MPAEPPANATSKRHCETESHGSDVSSVKGKSKGAPRPSGERGKRHKAADNVSSDEEDGPEPDVPLGEDTAELQAEVNEAATNAQPYKLTADAKRAKWAKNSARKTPEEALGLHPIIRLSSPR